MNETNNPYTNRLGLDDTDSTPGPELQLVSILPRVEGRPGATRRAADFILAELLDHPDRQQAA